MEIDCKKAAKKIKERAAVEQTAIPQIHAQELCRLVEKYNNNKEAVANFFPKLNNIKGSVYGARHMDQPDKPKTLEEINLDGEYILTNNINIS